MFAMFHLGRMDVLPVGDLGVRNGMKHLYSLKVRPEILLQSLCEIHLSSAMYAAAQSFYSIQVGSKFLRFIKEA